MSFDKVTEEFGESLLSSLKTLPLKRGGGTNLTLAYSSFQLLSFAAANGWANVVVTCACRPDLRDLGGTR